ncbi:sensor histidine kinase [Bacillus marasmi]|uniref:sensor histidine kinase n=1 Tax=Bacillus marasmi TaxID=1926279 RepID=UPI0011C79D95|nr:HAMP domain-containing sensor histidine kinase [Bacillus marasmi]
MIYFTILAVVIGLVSLTRNYFLKREIKRATQQLREVNHQETEKKIDLSFYDKDIEALAVEINAQIDLTKRAHAEKRRTENELKQAIADISHDIRTPMTSILGYVQLLESKDLPVEKREEYVEVVKSGALRLKDLLGDFFELSIIESADYPIVLEQIRLNQLVQEVLVGFYEEFNTRDIEPIIEIPTEEIRIHADSSAVKRVLENLILNAIRHSSGAVTISLERRDSKVMLFISNPAGQLNQQDLAHLFNRFYKADKTRSKKGTGLGLAISKSLMQKMGGELTAQLTDGELMMRCVWRG